MTSELIVVAVLVAAAVGYLVRKLFLRKKGACDSCGLQQAVEGQRRTPGKASPSSDSTR